MSKIKKFIILYPSWERGGATVNLINFINYCTKKKIQTYLISNINNKDQKTFFTKGVNFVKIKDSKNNSIYKKSEEITVKISWLSKSIWPFLFLASVASLCQASLLQSIGFYIFDTFHTLTIFQSLSV